MRTVLALIELLRRHPHYARPIITGAWRGFRNN